MAEGKRQKAKGLPEGWREVKLGEVAALQTGPFGSQLHSYDYIDRGVSVVMPSDIADGEIDFEYAAKISEEKFNEVKRHKLETGDLVFSRRGDVRRAAEYKDATKAICGTGCLRVRPLAKIAEPAYLASIVGLESSKNWLIDNAVGQTMPNMNTEILGRFPLLLPPLPEQRKIAAILSTWDDSIATLTNLLAAKRQQKRGLAEQLLTGKKRLKGFEGAWEEKPIGSLFESSLAGEWGKDADDTELSIPVFRATNFGKLGELDLRPEKLVKRAMPEKKFQKILLKRGDIILEKSGGSPGQPVGRVRYFDSDGNFGFSNFMNRLRPLGNYNSKFIFYCLDNFYSSGRILEYQQQTTGIINLQLQDYLEFGKVFVPPLPEQQAIASVLSTLDAEIASLEALRGKVQEQKRGLMDELLTGRVRVKVEETC